MTPATDRTSTDRTTTLTASRDVLEAADIA